MCYGRVWKYKNEKREIEKLFFMFISTFVFELLFVDGSQIFYTKKKIYDIVSWYYVSR